MKSIDSALQLWTDYAAENGVDIATQGEGGQETWHVIKRKKDHEFVWDVIHAFKVTDALRAWCDLEHWTKGELAEWRLSGYTYDCALPQGWLDEQCRYVIPELRDDVYQHVLRSTVWLYDGKAPLCGRPFNLFTDTDETPRKES